MVKAIIRTGIISFVVVILFFQVLAFFGYDYHWSQDIIQFGIAILLSTTITRLDHKGKFSFLDKLFKGVGLK